MSNPTVLLNKMAQRRLDLVVDKCGDEALRHFASADETLQSSGCILASDFMAIVMTPYSAKDTEDDGEFDYLFEIMLLDHDCMYFDKSMYYGESKIDWGKDVKSKEMFTIHGRDDAQQVFGFLCSQFYY